MASPPTRHGNDIHLPEPDHCCSLADAMNVESREHLVGQAALAVDPDLRPVIWAEFVAPILQGSEPYVQQLTIANDVDLAVLTNLGSIRSSVEGTDWVIRLLDGKIESDRPVDRKETVS